MDRLQQHQLEWIQAQLVPVEWSLNNKAADHQPIAVVMQVGEKWKGQVHNPNGGYTTIMPLDSCREVKQGAEDEALKLWEGQLTPLEMPEPEPEVEALEVEVV